MTSPEYARAHGSKLRARICACASVGDSQMGVISTRMLSSKGCVHPAPAPRFSRTRGAATAETSGEETLRRWGVEYP
jgi:hypothetical protein